MPKIAVKKQPSPIDVHVGSKIRARRLEIGMSQSNLAFRIGVTFQQVQKYEKGTNRVGSSRLHQIAKILNVDVQDFFPDASKADSVNLSLADRLCSTRRGVRLAEAFLAIENTSFQEAIVKLAETLAGKDDDPSANCPDPVRETLSSSPREPMRE